VSSPPEQTSSPTHKRKAPLLTTYGSVADP